MDTGSILVFLKVILSLLFNYYLIIIIARLLVALIIQESLRLEILSIIARYSKSSCCGQSNMVQSFC
jgi:hypothetical protein